VKVAFKKRESSLSIASLLIVSCLGIMLVSLMYVNFGLTEVVEEPTKAAQHQLPAQQQVLRTSSSNGGSSGTGTATDKAEDDDASVTPIRAAVAPNNGATTARTTNCCSLAQRESNSFFTDISDADWTLKKQIYQSMQPNNSGKNLSKQKRKADPSDFWNNNYEPEFTCPMQRRLGIPTGDGGKWVCDPHRIHSSTADGNKEREGCLVYSVGSNGNAVFEKSMHEVLSPNCNNEVEIHTFDLKGWNKRNGLFKDRVSEAGAVFHEWGLTIDEMNFEQDEYFIPKVYRTLNFKTFRQTFEELGHTGRVIDVLKIDCEGCEWQSVQGWLRDWKASGVVVRQLLLELHDAPLPQAPEFFQTLKEAGYVIFHKEVTGSCAEYAFVLVDTVFFQ